jgi:hypothetical protein
MATDWNMERTIVPHLFAHHCNCGCTRKIKTHRDKTFGNQPHQQQQQEQQQQEQQPQQHKMAYRVRQANNVDSNERKSHAKVSGFAALVIALHLL